MSQVNEIDEGPLPQIIMTSTEPIAMLAEARVLPEREEEFTELVREILPKIRAEEGNIHYTVNRSHGAEATYTLYEEWADGAALLAHLQQPFMADYFSRVPALTAPGADTPRWSSPL